MTLSDTTAYLVTGRQGLFETTDGGRQWSEMGPTGSDFTDLSTPTPTMAVALFSSGGLWHTTDGTKWTPVTPG